MRVAFHHIAYQPLAVCNALSMARLEATVRRAGLKAEARVLDIGCAYGEVSMHLARAFDARVTAVELDPVMAEGAEARIQAAGLSAQIAVRREPSAAALTALPAFDLIVAIGSTEPAGKGLREPAAVFAALAEHQVELITDELILQKVDAGVWADVVAALVRGLKTGSPAAGFEAAVRQCGDVLAAHEELEQGRSQGAIILTS